MLRSRRCGRKSRREPGFYQAAPARLARRRAYKKTEGEVAALQFELAAEKHVLQVKLIFHKKYADSSGKLDILVVQSKQRGLRKKEEGIHRPIVRGELNI